jgi:hypothetical protein
MPSYTMCDDRRFPIEPKRVTPEYESWKRSSSSPETPEKSWSLLIKFKSSAVLYVLQAAGVLTQLSVWCRCTINGKEFMGPTRLAIPIIRVGQCPQWARNISEECIACSTPASSRIVGLSRVNHCFADLGMSGGSLSHCSVYNFPKVPGR